MDWLGIRVWENSNRLLYTRLSRSAGQSSWRRNSLSGEDLNKVSVERMRELRGVNISMIFQDPMMTLNPVLRIDTQMMEQYVPTKRYKEIARQRARDALGQVGIASPDERLRAYPHQFSGGMRQEWLLLLLF